MAIGLGLAWVWQKQWPASLLSALKGGARKLPGEKSERAGPHPKGSVGQKEPRSQILNPNPKRKKIVKKSSVIPDMSKCDIYYICPK